MPSPAERYPPTGLRQSVDGIALLPALSGKPPFGHSHARPEWRSDYWRVRRELDEQGVGEFQQVDLGGRI